MGLLALTVASAWTCTSTCSVRGYDSQWWPGAKGKNGDYTGKAGQYIRFDNCGFKSGSKLHNVIAYMRTSKDGPLSSFWSRKFCPKVDVVDANSSGAYVYTKKNVEPSLLEKVDCYPKIEIVGC